MAAAFFFILRRPGSALALAMLAIAAAASGSVRPLLEPAFSSQTVRRFTDGSMLIVQGRIVRPAALQPDDRIYLYMELTQAGPSLEKLLPTSGLVRITAPENMEFRIGDQIRASGRIRFPRNEGNPGEFDYRGWLLRQGIAATMFVAGADDGSAPPITILGHRDVVISSQIEEIRSRIRRFIDSTLKYPENAEMRALIIGDRGGIDERLRQPFAVTGMAHLLVISGLHLGLVAAAAFLIARLAMMLFPGWTALGYANKTGAVFAALVVCAYASIAGDHVSTSRALVMVLAYTLAILIDRSRELLASLTLAALVICFAIPGSTADLGFQLSFASVLTILLGMRRFAAWWRWHYHNPLAATSERSRLHRAMEWLCGYFAVSFWAMLGTAPLTAFHFNQFSLIGVIGNAIVVPIMGVGAVIAGLVAASLSFVYSPLARALMLCAGRFAAIGSRLARGLSDCPFAWARAFTPTLVELFIAYSLLLLWLTAPLAGEEVLAMMRGRHVRAAPRPFAAREQFRNLARVALVAAFMLDAGWWTYQRFFNPDLRVTFLSVGEGDAAVVRFPGSRVMLVDGGGAFRGTFDPGERIVAPYLWSNKIMHVDYVTLSHPDLDHLGGLIYILRNFAPSKFWTGGAVSDDQSYAELIRDVRSERILQRTCDSSSASLEVGGVALRCVGPQHETAELKHNNSSMILRLSYYGRAVLFTGDVEEKGERELLESGDNLRANILKVPHHGSYTSSSPAFIEAVHPEIAVISLGYLNQFHFPSPQVIERYEQSHVRVLRTDNDGAVIADLGAGGLNLSTFRGGSVQLPAR